MPSEGTTEVPGGALGNAMFVGVGFSAEELAGDEWWEWEELREDEERWEVHFGGQAPGTPSLAMKHRVVMVDWITTVVVLVVVERAVVVTMFVAVAGSSGAGMGLGSTE